MSNIIQPQVFTSRRARQLLADAARPPAFELIRTAEGWVLIADRELSTFELGQLGRQIFDALEREGRSG